VHLVAKDDNQAAETAQWFRELIASERPVTTGQLRNHNLSIDDVAFTVFPIGARFTPRENDGTLRNTDGSHLDHVAFSFRDLPAAWRRIQKMGVEIVQPMKREPDYGFRHFFVRAPNGVLVELVEAKPWPDAAWE
jgi:catechol 2,3-dioxygenase-like lactoylglutathione lyase family enzyme